MRSFEEYISLIDNYNLNGIQAEIITDCIDDIEESIELLDDEEVIELLEQYGETVYLMENIDDEVGSIYPSEFYDYFPDGDFSFDDRFFIERYSREYESGNDVWRLTGVSVNDIATAIYNEDIDTYDDDINELVETAKDYLKRLNNAYRVQKAVEDIELMITNITESEDPDKIQELKQVIWNAYNN